MTLTYILPTVPNRNQWKLCLFLHVVSYMPIRLYMPFRMSTYVTFVVYKVLRAYIDGCSALGVVYEVSLDVVLVTHVGCAGDVGIAIWRARLFGSPFRVGVWSEQT